MEQIKYKRILLKLSGEALGNEIGVGIDPHCAVSIAKRVKEVREMGVDVAIVIGAGNLWRGRHQEGTENRPQPGRNPANSEYLPFRENAHFAGLFARSARNGKWHDS